MSFRARVNGFWLNFSNGIVLSTQFAYGNYCEGHELFLQKMLVDKELYQKVRDNVKNAEIAVGTEKELTIYTKQMWQEVFNENLNDNVAGYIDIEKWLKIVDWCKKFTLKEQ